MADATEDQFQEEVLKLFAEEGLEWVSQIKTSLQEIESGNPPDKIAKNYDLVLRSLTNLMGSAATVELSALQKLALALIPLLQAMQSKKVPHAPEHFATIRQGLALLASAVQVLNMADSKTVVVGNLEGIMQLQAEHIQRAVGKIQGIAPPAKPAAKDESPERKFLAAVVLALLELKHSRPSSLEPTRNLIEIVLRRLHRLLDQDTVAVTAASVTSILNQVEGLDARFLEEMQKRAGSIKKVFLDLKAGKGDPAAQKRNLQNSLREISFLFDMARDVGAAPIAQFLHGLEILLLEVVYKGVALGPPRIEVVASRVDTLVHMTQQWVEMGLAEKAAIDKALVPIMDANLAHK